MEFDEHVPTVEYSPADGIDFSVLVSVLWSSEGFTDERIREIVENSADEALAWAVESELPLTALEGNQGEGWYFSVTDKNPTPEPDNYKYMVQGMARVGPFGLTFTALADVPHAPSANAMLELITEARAR